MSLSFMSHSVLCSWTKTVANKAPVDARPLQIRHGLGMWLAEGSLDMQSGARVHAEWCKGKVAWHRGM